MQRFYGQPSDATIASYEAEITALIKHGYLERVWYGFKRDGKWVEPTLRYSSRDLQGSHTDDNDPGRVKPGADISNASFYSFLSYSTKWYMLDLSDRQKFEADLPLTRGTASEPQVGGFMLQDKTYSAGGYALDRSTVRGG
jgi:hypothetical protein